LGLLMAPPMNVRMQRPFINYIAAGKGGRATALVQDGDRIRLDLLLSAADLGCDFYLSRREGPCARAALEEVRR